MKIIIHTEYKSTQGGRLVESHIRGRVVESHIRPTASIAYILSRGFNGVKVSDIVNSFSDATIFWSSGDGCYSLESRIMSRLKAWLAVLFG